MEDARSPLCRVILLLDLDCFYAQCERVRLGLEEATCALALLQWNSTLAVTYPARRLYGIKRGDKWEDVEQKSGGKCLSIHLPILRNGQTHDLAEHDIKTAYDKVFRLTQPERNEIMEKEINKRRHNWEGKACLERYRLASSRIFGVIQEALEEGLGKANFVLERASIDELYLDVTKHCWKEGVTDEATLSRVMDTTVRVGKQDNHDDDPALVRALERGCWVGSTVRRAVLEKLGFTLSAGVSTSKMVAKLGASYGKPNGQAVIYPSSIPFVMNQTPVGKARNLGGKVGKRVCAMLTNSNGEPTMGYVARNLSLPRLAQELGPETARWVWEAARGIDHEPVRSTLGALVKSITTCKSFPSIRLSSGEILSYLELLATDMASRVQLDSQRNHRYPKSCTVHYSFTTKQPWQRVHKSVRIPFPKEERNPALVLAQQCRCAVLEREGPVEVHRIGLSASDFENRMPNGGIASYFQKDKEKRDPTKGVATTTTTTTTARDDDNIPQPNMQSEQESHFGASRKRRFPETASDNNNNNNVVESDLELARRLQSKFNREAYVLATVEARASRPNVNKHAKRIDTFFRCKPSTP